MRSKNKTIPQHLLLKAIVFSLLFTVEFTFAQAALTASGGEAVGAGGSLTITNVASEDLSYRLFDINRRLISSHKIKNHETIIPMERLASATYLLYVLGQNTQLKVFKIIKE